MKILATLGLAVVRRVKPVGVAHYLLVIRNYLVKLVTSHFFDIDGDRASFYKGVCIVVVVVCRE